METAVAEIIALWGVFGIIFFGACYIIYDNIRSNKKGADANLHIKNNQENIGLMQDLLEDRLDSIDKNIELVNNNALLLNDKLESEISRLDEKIDGQYIKVVDEIDNRASIRKEEHNKSMYDQIKIGPKLHNIMNLYLSRINTDHILLGSFHNGKSSITGIPYYKYDIIAERFSPEKIDRDIEFAYMYKDVDILRHDKLPITLMNKGMVYFKINPDKTSDLSEIDDIIYRRMIGRDIKLIAIHILRQRDSNSHIKEGKPIGFVGCIRYDYNEMNFSELDKCADELEAIYNENK